MALKFRAAATGWFLSLALPAAALARGGDDTNQISGVTIEELADETRIVIDGDEHPTYSVYRLRNPLRLFVDVANSEVASEIATSLVDNGVIRSVGVGEYDDQLTHVTRIVVEFDKDALYDVTGDGDDLVISIDGTNRNLFVAQGPSSDADAERLREEIAASQDRLDGLSVALTVAEQRQAELESQLALANAALQSAEAASLEQELARSQTEAELLAERVRSEEAERERLAAVAARANIDVEINSMRSQIGALSQTVASQSNQIATQSTQIASLQTEREHALAEVQRLRQAAETASAEIQRRDAELLQLQTQDDDLRRRINDAQGAGQNSAQLQALLAERERTLAELQARQGELESLVSASQAREQELAAALSAAEQQARVAAAAPVAAAPAAPALAASASLTVADIRFENSGATDRVVIELPPGAEYSSLPYEAGRSGIILANAVLPDGLRRTLDTARFSGPVSFVSSYTDAEGRIRVVADLKSDAAEVIRRDGDKLIWEFTTTTETASTTVSTLPNSSGGSYSTGVTAARDYSNSTGEDEGFRLAKPQMSNKRITIDLREADIQNVLRLMADEGNINIVSGDGVYGTITLRLRSVPLDDALVLILRSKNLGWEQQGNILRVAPIGEFEYEYNARIAAQINSWRLQPLVVRIIPLSYVEAPRVQALAFGSLSSRGRVVVDDRNNAIIVTDIQSNVDMIERLVREIDTQTPLVLIEARIVETNDQFERQVGIQWGGDFLAAQALGNSTGLLFPSTIGIAGGAAAGDAPNAGTSSTPNYAVNLPASVGTGSGGAIGMTLGSLSGSFNLNLRLSAAEDQGSAKIITAPRILTLDNQAASITSGVSIPYSVVSAAGAQTSFIDAALTLNVTPRVTPDGNILLAVNIAKNEPDFQNTGSRGEPSIVRREARTNLLVPDGNTTVIGGIFSRNTGRGNKRVPFFGSLPVIGPLFRNSSTSDVRSEMMVFITPRIVNRDLSINMLQDMNDIEANELR